MKGYGLFGSGEYSTKQLAGKSAGFWLFALGLSHRLRHAAGSHHAVLDNRPSPRSDRIEIPFRCEFEIR
jgi:hypothetical protein